MRDIRDASSPYHDSYTELDYWCYANAISDEEFYDSPPWAEGADPNAEVFYVSVNPKGYMVPVLDDMRAQFEQSYGGAEPEGETCEVSYFSYGVLPDELAQSYYGMQAEIIAPHVEPIPGWLGDNPPVSAVIVPEGVALLGELGDGTGRYTLSWDGNDPETWALYDHEGEFQRTGKSLEPWQALFFDGYTELRSKIDSEENAYMYEFGQYVVVYRFGESYEDSEMEIYSYTGEKLDIDEDEMYAESAKYEQLAGEMLRLVSEIQQREK